MVLAHLKLFQNLNDFVLGSMAFIIERVKKILANPEAPEVPRLEAEIDQIVYALYVLTEDEIALIEGKK